MAGTANGCAVVAAPADLVTAGSQQSVLAVTGTNVAHPCGSISTMTSVGLMAVPDGQRRAPALRSRDLSGIRSRATSPLSYSKHVLALRDVVEDIGDPVWVARAIGGCAARLRRLSARARRTTCVVPRGRNVVRVGHVIHTARALDGRDVTRIDGLPVTSGTRTLIDLAATTDARR